MWGDSEATMASAGLPVVSPSRMRSPLTPNTSESTQSIRMPRASRTLWIRLRRRALAPTSCRRRRLTLRSRRNRAGGIMLGEPGPNWQLVASQALSPMPVLRPRICLTCWAFMSSAGDPGVFQGLEGRVPVDAGRFHDGGGDPMLKQPGDELPQAARQGAEDPGEDLHLRARPSPAHAGGHLHLVYVQARGAGMDEVQGVVPWRRFLLVMGVAERSGDLRTNDTHPHRDAAHVAVRPRANRVPGGVPKPSVGDNFSSGIKVGELATSTRPLPPMIVGTPPITTETPSGPQTNMARLLPGGRGVRAAPTMSVSPAGGRHRWADAQRTARRPWREPATARRSLKVVPISLIHSLLTRSVRTDRTRYRYEVPVSPRVESRCGMVAPIPGGKCHAKCVRVRPLSVSRRA